MSFDDLKIDEIETKRPSIGSKTESIAKGRAKSNDNGSIEPRIDEINKLKTNLDELITYLDFLELRMEIIEYKKRDLHREFNKRTQSFQEKKSDVDFSGASPSQISFQINIIEQDIDHLKHLFEEDMQALNNFKLELLTCLENLVAKMDKILEKIKIKFDEIPEILNTLPDVDPELRATIEELQNEISIYEELHEGGWTNKNIFDKMDAYLNSVGLSVNEDGFLMIMEKNEKITFTEAEKRNYFGNLNKRLTSLHRILPKEGTSDLSGSQSSEDITITPSSLFTDVTEADIQYLKEAVGTPLTLGLAELTAKQPRDPIHYLAHFLMKYRYNTEMTKLQQKEIDQLNAEREIIFKEKWQKFVLDEARKTLMDLLERVEYEVYLREMEKIQRELELSGKLDEENYPLEELAEEAETYPI